MTSARTLSGVLARIGLPSSTRAGTARAFDDLNTELPAGGVPVDVNHDGHQVGEVLYVERGADDRVQAVAVLDDAPWVDELDEPLYLSGRWELIGGTLTPDAKVFIARSAQLLSVALTTTPATVAATPLHVRAGDLRRPFDRSRWTPRWAQDGLLQRAADDTGDRADAQARWVTDRRRPATPAGWGIDPWTGGPASTPATRARPGQPWTHGGGHIIAVR